MSSCIPRAPVACWWSWCRTCLKAFSPFFIPSAAREPYRFVELTSTVVCEAKMHTRMNAYRLAVLYYFGELSYWKLPKIAQDALEQGYDGPSLRRLAGLINPVE